MAREISKDSRSRELDAADSGIGEEEMFSSVIRTSNNKETTYSNSTDNSNSSSTSNQNNSAAQSTNNSHSVTTNNTLKNNSLHSSNENLASNNDGFTTYTSKYRNRGGKNASNTVGPRLQRKHQEQQQQQQQHHQNGGNSYGNSRVPPRAQNGNSNRGTCKLSCFF